MPEAKRVALYARVSDPRDGRQHPEIQIEELRHYAEQRGWKITREYVDRITGAKDSRPQLNQLMLDARARKFDLILVWKLDRLGRSLRHLVNVLGEIEALGIGLVSLRESLDPTTPLGKAMFGMVAVMAEFERSLISERVQAGMRHARSRGIHVGRPRVKADAESIIAMRKRGVRWREIAGILGVSVGTAIGRIRNSGH